MDTKKHDGIIELYRRISENIAKKSIIACVYLTINNFPINKLIA